MDLSDWHLAIGQVNFNQFTAPGWFSALVNLINIGVIFWMFVEVSPGPDPNQKQEDKWYSQLFTQEMFAFSVCTFIFMVIIADFAVFETILTIYTSKYYYWKALQNSILLAVCGTLSIGIFVIVSMKFLEKYIGERMLMLSGLVLLLLSLLSLAQWPFFQHNVPILQFYFGCLLQALGYPIASALLGTISSKVIHPKNQGAKMGWLNAAGYAARMVAPILASDVAWRFGGAGLLFPATAFLMGLAVAVVLIWYHQLVPHPDNMIHKTVTGAIQ